MALNYPFIKKQMEYYLSDDNLKQDEFFHKKISECDNDQGQIDLDLFLKCRLIIKLNVKTIQELAQALEDSELLQLSQDKTKVGRKGNKPLPELIKKKQKTQNNAEGQVKNQEECKKDIINEQNKQIQQQDDKVEEFEPLIFSVSCSQESAVNWRVIQEVILKQYGEDAQYSRFSKTDGHFALNKRTLTDEKKEKIIKDGLNIGQNLNLTVQLTEGKDLEKFWELHGNHIQAILEDKKKAIAKQNQKKGAKNGKDGKKKDKCKKKFTFAGEKYSDMQALRNCFKGILGRTSNGDEIKEPYHSMLKELLKYHDKGEQKLQKLKHFTVGVHPDHKDTRCFFVVRDDNSQEDFSQVKCLNNFEEQVINK